MNLEEHIVRQIKFSERVFGPGRRQKGILDHIQKECAEVENESALDEWVDLILLTVDGAWRHVAHHPDDQRIPYMRKTRIARIVCTAIDLKHGRNQQRIWPDWRKVPRDKAIEHDRTGERRDPRDEVIAVMRAALQSTTSYLAETTAAVGAKGSREWNLQQQISKAIVMDDERE